MIDGSYSSRQTHNLGLSVVIHRLCCIWVTFVHHLERPPLKNNTCAARRHKPLDPSSLVERKTTGGGEIVITICVTGINILRPGKQ